MSLINRAIPNLFQGVSQQPASIRLETQAEVQENAFSSVVDGLKKRPPTKHIAKLRTTSAVDAYVHTINRDTTERYVVIITNGDLEVYNIAGTKMTVNFPNGKAYLSSTTPRTEFACVTIADYTFVCNKTKVIAKGTSTAGGTLKGSKQRMTDLPTTGQVVNDVWYVTGEAANQFNKYYVMWDGSVWRECAAPGTLNSLDATTMPWQLVRTAVNTFTFQPATWTTRPVGDDTSIPMPSFVGRKLNDIFFHRNRLGVCADENVVFSKAGKFFTFFPDSVTVVLDSDPIDVSVNHTKVSIIRYAVPFATSLMLFSDTVQFQLSARDLLTPKTVNINATTEFEFSGKAKPVGIGQDLYFPVEKGLYTGIREYFVQPLTYTNDAEDVTSHVPKYIPANVFKLVASNSEDMLFALNAT